MNETTVTSDYALRPSSAIENGFEVFSVSRRYRIGTVYSDYDAALEALNNYRLYEVV